jgi:hypothetical protein
MFDSDVLSGHDIHTSSVMPDTPTADDGVNAVIGPDESDDSDTLVANTAGAATAYAPKSTATGV